MSFRTPTHFLIRKIEQEVRITASVGLSYNKFLAKIASDLDKPRGFAVIGRQEAEEFLSEKPVRTLPGVGPALDSMQRANPCVPPSTYPATDLTDITDIVCSLSARQASVFWAAD